MRARARVVAAAGPAGTTRLVTLRSQAPLLLRATTGGLHLVGGAAGPVGGDDLRLDVDVGVGATVAVRSAAATVALPGPAGAQSRTVVTATVREGATLHWLPEPGVAAAGCRHLVEARIALAPGGRLVWREEVVLGRHGEGPGSWTSVLAADVAGSPVLRTRLDLGPGAPAWDGPAVAGGAGAVGSLLVVDPAWAHAPPPAAALAPTAAVMPLHGPAALVSALAPDALALRLLLDEGLARLTAATAGAGDPAWPVASALC